MAKGGSFERKIATALSLWWSNGERDDIFWRTSGSGARAKVRSYKGKGTFGQTGDLQATDPIGSPLIELCNFELKNGYKRWSIMDVVDRPEKKANQKERTKQTFETFIEKTVLDSQIAKSPYPCLITKKDSRLELITFPRDLYYEIKHRQGIIPIDPCIGLLYFSWNGIDFVMMRLSDWFINVRPETMLDIYNEYKSTRRVIRAKKS